MAPTPYPLPRSTRETAVLVGDGATKTFGPFDGLKIFDVEDVVVWVKEADDGGFWDSSAYIEVEKTTADAFSFFTVTFDTAPAGTTQFVVQAARTAERSIAVTRAGVMDGPETEKELSKQASALSELRRDVGRALQLPPGSTANPMLPPAAAKQVLRWNADGSAIENGSVVAMPGELVGAANEYFKRNAGNDGFEPVNALEVAADIHKAAAYVYLPSFEAGYKGDGVQNDYPALQASIDRAAIAGGTVVVNKPLAVSQMPTVKSNVTLRIAEGGKLTLIAALVTMLTFAPLAENARIEGPGIIDAADLASTYTVYGQGLKDCSVGGKLKIVNWKRAVSLFSKPESAFLAADGVPLVRPVVDGVLAYSPSTSNGVQFPILIASGIADPWVIDAKMNNNIVIGREGAHSSNGIRTADQLAAQGWDGGEVIGNLSLFGGENGITVARMSRRVTVSRNTVRFCDAHGINIGSGNTALPVASTSDFTTILGISGGDYACTFSGSAGANATLTISPAPAAGNRPLQQLKIYVFGGSNAGIWTVTGAPAIGADWSATVERLSGNANNLTLGATASIFTGLVGGTSGTTAWLRTRSEEATTYDVDGLTLDVVPGHTLFAESTVGSWIAGEDITDGIATSALSAAGALINSDNKVNNNTCQDNRLDVAGGGTDANLAEIYWQQASGSCKNNTLGRSDRANTNGTCLRDGNSDVYYADNDITGGITEINSQSPKRGLSGMRVGSTTNFAGERATAGLSIAANAITPTHMIHRLVPETGNEDDIVSIAAGMDGQFLFLYTNSAAYRIRVRNTASIRLFRNRDHILQSVDDFLFLVYSSALGGWQEVGLHIPSGVVQRPMRGAAGVMYHPDGKATTSNQAVQANRLYCQPITFATAFAATKMSIEVTTLAAGKARMSLYADDGTGHPGDLLVDAGEVDTGTTGTKELTFASTLLFGRIWAEVIFDATPTVNCVSTTNTANGSVQGTTSAGVSGYYRAQTYGAPPASEAAETYTAASSSIVPCILVGA